MALPGSLLIVVATAAESGPLAELALDAEILVCGVGKIAAATATALRLVDGGVAGVVSCGVAGAYPGSDLAIGDVVIATEVAVLDEGLDDGARFVPFARPGMPVPAAAWRATDPLLRSDLAAAVGGTGAAGTAGVPGALRAGRIATVSVCAGSERLARERAATGALCEAMEGAAIAEVASRYDVPFAEVRGISNACGPRDGAPFDLSAGAAAAARIVARLLSEQTP